MALTCTVLGFRALVIDDIVLFQSLPFLTFQQLITLDYLTVYIGVPLFAQFIRSSFKQHFRREVMVTIVLISSTYTLSLLVFSIDTSSRLILSYQLFTLLLIIPVSYTHLTLPTKA